ncbi:hypothetical protein C0J50_20832 [Silurus asotus]|uniref:Endonuclease/exonuclease/phosphatase domain-containing protein n=1 Tax=Silurus asotus TaxID=30991 RepID=A0AAD5FJL2_SILAS|nr:hypothetical protein C0J50_20832 [Silurus asotus]
MDCADQLASVLTDIFNISLSQAVVPASFKKTTIILVPNKSTCQNRELQAESSSSGCPGACSVSCDFETGLLQLSAGRSSPKRYSSTANDPKCNAATLVFNLPKFSHITPLLLLHWLPVAARIRFKTLMLAYKAKNGPAPSYLSDLITSHTAPRCLRSSSTARLVPPSLRMREIFQKPQPKEEKAFAYAAFTSSKLILNQFFCLLLGFHEPPRCSSHVYAPQFGCEMEEKEKLWSELNEVVDGVPRKEQLVIGADFNGHVGEGNRGDEEVMGRYGFKERNVEGQMVVDFAKRMEMAVVNTYFKKKEDHRVTYKSRGRCTQVDYVLCRRCNLKEIGDCKVLAGDSVARQHRRVVCRMVLEAKKKRRRVKTERRIRWWKLKEEECSVRFREEVRQGLSGGEEVLDDWAATAGVMREAARKVLGVTSGNRKQDKETWWWNEEVQESIRRKKLAK